MLSDSAVPVGAKSHAKDAKEDEKMPGISASTLRSATEDGPGRTRYPSFLLEDSCIPDLARLLRLKQPRSVLERGVYAASMLVIHTGSEKFDT